MSANPAPFWLVWRDSGASPTHRHPTADEAHAEARRLAKCNPGARFFVAKAESMYQGTIVVEGRALDPQLGTPNELVVTPPSAGGLILGPAPRPWDGHAPRTHLGDPPPGVAYDAPRPQPTASSSVVDREFMARTPHGGPLRDGA